MKQTTITVTTQVPTDSLAMLREKAVELGFTSLEDFLSGQLEKAILALQVPKDWVPDEHNVMGQLLQNTPAKASEDEDEDEVIDLTAES